MIVRMFTLRKLLSTEAKPRSIIIFEGGTFLLSPSQECCIYFIIPKLLSAFVYVSNVKQNHRHFRITGQKYGYDVASFWCNVMMSYLILTITECQAAQAAQIWYQNVYFNLLKKLCDEIRVLIVPSLK